MLFRQPTGRTTHPTHSSHLIRKSCLTQCISPIGTPIGNHQNQPPAWLAVRHNDWAAGIVAHVSKGAKGRRRQAIVALARKLLVRLWAMLRDGTNWLHPKQGATNGEEGKTPPEGLAGLLQGPEPAV